MGSKRTSKSKSVRQSAHRREEGNESLSIGDKLNVPTFLAAIDKNLIEGVFVVNGKSSFLYANDAFLKMTGVRTFAELQKKKFRNFWQPTNYQHFIKQLNAVGKVSFEEVVFQIAAKRKLWARLIMSTHRDKSNKTVFIGNIVDITGRKQVERELLNSRDFLYNMINTVDAPIFVKDKHHRWILFNQAFFSSRDRKLLAGKTDYDFIPKKASDQIWKIDNEVLRTGKTITREEIIPDLKGGELTVLTTKSRFINDRGERFIIGFIMDITDRKRFEEIIKSMNASMRGVLESTKDQILAIDRFYRYTMFNQAHARSIKQLSAADIKIGDNLLSVLPAELSRKIRKDINKALSGKSFTTEVTFPNKIETEITYSTVEDDRKKTTGVALFIRDITKRKITETKFRLLNDELTEQNWQLASREEELKIALEELSERNFDLDQLVYKTSHDLRSPLSSIMGLVNLAQLDRDPKNRDEYINKIEGRIKKLDDFIKSMLTYARMNRGEDSIEKIDLEKVASNAIRELEYLENFKSLKTSITVKNKEIPFKSDPLRVGIIFSNIISNAYKYLNKDVASYLKIKILLDPLNAYIEFKDNGIGIKKEYLPRIFDMFYRATDRSEGSGLGMYIVKQAVDRLKGEISIYSDLGSGTTIKLKLPSF